MTTATLYHLSPEYIAEMTDERWDAYLSGLRFHAEDTGGKNTKLLGGFERVRFGDGSALRVQASNRRMDIISATQPHLRGSVGCVQPFDITANDDCWCIPGRQAEISHIADNIAHAIARSARAAARQERTITIDDIVF